MAQTIPGGLYKVAGVEVDASGKVIGKRSGDTPDVIVEPAVHPGHAGPLTEADAGAEDTKDVLEQREGREDAAWKASAEAPAPASGEDAAAANRRAAAKQAAGSGSGTAQRGAAKQGRSR